MPKIVDKKEMRASLLEGCFGLFAEKGFAAVTMRDLATTLDVSTGTLYHYFDNKSALFDQMLRHLVERDIARVLRTIEDTDEPATRVQLVLDYVEQNESHFRGLLSLLFDFQRQSDQEAAGAFRDLLGVYRETIAANLGVGDQRIGYAVMSIIIGTLVQRVADPEGVSIQELRTIMNDSFAGLVPA